MAQFKEKAFQVLEDAYLKIMSEPTIGMGPDELKERGEALRQLTLDMLRMETANLSELQAAFEVEGKRMTEALKAMEEAIKANTDYLTMLQSIDHSLDIMRHFFFLLL